MKRNPKMLRIAAAVTAAFGMASTAQAVNLAADGRGELIYVPYYTVQNGMNTDFTLTNTSPHTLAVKVQFREADNSVDVRDFHVYLSPQDVWHATVTQGNNGGARVVTSDNSCTVPFLVDQGDGTRGVEFTELNVVRPVGEPVNSGNGPATAEGYIALTVIGTSPAGMESINDTVAQGAKHINGVPRDCGRIVWGWEQWENFNVPIVQNQFGEPVNALAATSQISSPGAGNMVTVDPTIIANFNNPRGIDGLALNDFQANIMQAPADPGPTETDALPATAAVMTDAGPVVYGSFPQSEDAVSATMMRTTVSDLFTTAGDATTEMVVTFPTKYHYMVVANGGEEAIDERAPFTDKSPRVGFGYTDHEEFAPVCEAGVDPRCSVPFSPRPSVTVTEIRMPHEVTVVRVNGSNALASVNGIDVDTPSVEAGWMSIAFTDSLGLAAVNNTTNTPVTLSGLPAAGFSYHTSNNSGVSDTTVTEAHYTRGVQ